MFQEYLPVFLQIIVAIGFAVSALLVSRPARKERYAKNTDEGYCLRVRHDPAGRGPAAL